MKLKIMMPCCMAILLAAQPAFAEKEGHGHGWKHKSKHKYERHYDDRDRNVIIINNSDRVVIREYINDDYYRHCPPGLAKKRNGCIPPGHAKRYVIGEPLIVAYQPVPAYVVERLEPVPYGYRYVRVDQDVLLISEASKKVIDAVTLLSAVGR